MHGEACPEAPVNLQPYFTSDRKEGRHAGANAARFPEQAAHGLCWWLVVWNHFYGKDQKQRARNAGVAISLPHLPPYPQGPLQVPVDQSHCAADA